MLAAPARSRAADVVVGAVMLALGMLGLVNTVRLKRRLRQGGKNDVHDASSAPHLDCDDGVLHAAAHELRLPHAHEPPAALSPAGAGGAAQPEASPPELPAAPQLPERRSTRERLLALLVGLVHGVSGPGSVLGVVPALLLHSAAASSAYLLSFIAASIATMAAFAVAFGELARRRVFLHLA